MTNENAALLAAQCGMTVTELRRVAAGVGDIEKMLAARGTLAPEVFEEVRAWARAGTPGAPMAGRPRGADVLQDPGGLQAPLGYHRRLIL